MTTTSSIRLTVCLLCFSCAATVDAQVGPRTTAPPPVDIKLVNTPRGIKIVRSSGLSPETPVLPAPGAPLEVSLASAQIRFLTATMEGTTKQTLCAGSGTCAIAVRYKLKEAEKSIYLIRAGGKLVFVTPDKFHTEGQSGVLRKGAITKIEEMGGPSVTFDRDTQFIVDFHIKE
jgi:hypothetical protein